VLSGQTAIDLKSQSRQVDFGGAPATRVSKTGTSLPPVCEVGQSFFKSDAAPGLNLYGCTATNVWSLLGDGGGSAANALTSTTTFPFTNRVLRSDGTTRLVKSSICEIDDTGNMVCPGSVASGDGVATGYVEALAGTTPADPPPGKFRLYFDSANSNRLTDRNGAGVTRLYLIDPGASGLAARTTGGVLTPRSITGTAGEITVTNGDGASANPAVGLAASIDLSAKTSTKPSKAGVTRPVTCSPGETFIETGALPHSQWLVCTATDTWTPAGAPVFEPSGLVEWDDFLPGSSASGQLGKFGWVSAGTVTDNDAANLFENASLPGTLLMRSTADWSDVRMGVNKYGPLLPAVGSQLFESHFIVYPLTLTGVHHRVGWNRQDFGSGVDYQDTSLSMIYRDGTDTNWMFQACHAASCVAVDSGVTPVAATVYRLRIRTLAAGAYRFAISTAGGAFSAEKTICASGCNGTLAAIPSSAGYLSPYFAIKSLDTTAKEALVDYFGYKITSLAR
jgi:hypothetical protein